MKDSYEDRRKRSEIEKQISSNQHKRRISTDVPMTVHVIVAVDG